MLRRSLLRALDRKRLSRPVMAKARGVPGRARTALPAATLVPAGEPIYTGEELELPREMAPAFQRRAHGLPMATARGAIQKEWSPYRHAPARALGAQEEELEDGEDLDDAGHDEGSYVGRTVLGRNGSGAGEDDVDDGDEEDVLGAGAEEGGDAGVDGSAPAAVGPRGAQKSKEAYRFLLDHIDAEIAALQRRHTAVTTRRQNLEERNSHRIKELFEFMESPWLLLASDVPPPLPATGVDVYLKEQRTQKGGAHPGGATSTHGTADTQHDKLFVLACHKNYRSLPLSEKRYYEEAAHYNAAVRQELKYRLATGCARFEVFCQQVKECTPAMARAGQVPEVPATWHGGGGGGHRYQGLSQWQRTARQAQAASTAPSPGGDKASSSTASRHPKASRRIKDAAAASTTSAKGKKSVRQKEPAAAADEEREAESDAEDAEDVEEVDIKSFSKKVGKGSRARKRVAAAKPKAATKPPPKTKSGKAASPAKHKAARAKSTPVTKKGGGKTAVSSASHSASIPLPDLNKLAIKKIKKVAAAVAADKGGKKSSGKFGKPAPKKAGGGKGKKK